MRHLDVEISFIHIMNSFGNIYTELFVHPEDAIGLKKLEAILRLDKASQWLMNVGCKRLYYWMLMSVGAVAQVDIFYGYCSA